jgi:hypothetical protein
MPTWRRMATWHRMATRSCHLHGRRRRERQVRSRGDCVRARGPGLHYRLLTLCPAAYWPWALLRRPCSPPIVPSLVAISRCRPPLLCRSPRSPAISRCSLAPRRRACEMERRRRHMTCRTMAARTRAAATATRAARPSSCTTASPGSSASSPSVLNCPSGCLSALQMLAARVLAPC